MRKVVEQAASFAVVHCERIGCSALGYLVIGFDLVTFSTLGSLRTAWIWIRGLRGLLLRDFCSGEGYDMITTSSSM